MVVSWTIRGLELHQAGLQRSSFYIACQDFEDSSEMIWRTAFLYKDLRMRFPDWHLQAPAEWKGKKPDRLDSLRLPNGSTFHPLTGRDPNTFRQTGATGVSLEECAFFPRLAEVVSNAKVMCQGRPGEKDGFMCLVSTVNGANRAWMKMSH